MEEGQATADQCGEHGKLHLKTALDLSNKHSVMSFIHLCSLKNNFEYFLFSSVIYCFVYYLWVGHNYCYAYLAGFTALFLLPGEKLTL